MALKFTDASFQSEVLESDVPVLVDFYADWCGPCKMMVPVIEELSNEYEGKVKIGKLNVDEQPKTAEKYRVMSIPTILIIKNGQTVETIVGAVPKSSLVEKLEAHK